MTFSTKRIVLFFLALTLISLVLLSASLSNLQLHAGTPFPGSGNSDNDIQFFTELTPVRTYSFTILKGFFSFIFLILMIYVPARLIAFVDIKKTFQLLLTMAILLVIVNLISRITPDQPAHLPGESSGMATPPSFNYPVTPLGKPPQGLIQLVLIGFVFGAGLLAMKVLKLWPHPTRIEDQLSQEAEFYDVLLISPDPVDYVSRMLPLTGINALAVRAARVERIVHLKRLMNMGVHVINWQVNQPFETIINAAARNLAHKINI